jgi:hypothetical protein
MQLIAHRKNTIAELSATSGQLGIEVDVRIHNSKLVCQHDPLKPGDLFEEWLSHYSHKTLIVNVKEEGLEELVLEALARHKIEDFFFLDQSFPFLLKHAKKGLSRAAVRVSEFESLETALNLKGLVSWVWVDLFGDFPLSKENIQALKSAGFNLCLVSPELHGRTDEKLVSDLKELFKALEFIPDAVCTKRADLWGV